MKKPTIALKLRQARLARYRARERFLRAHLRRVPGANKYVVPGELIKAPKRFDVTKGSGREVVKFLRAVALAVLTKKIPVRLDFQLTESFYPAGTILLYAEVDRIVSLSELPKPITLRDPRARRPREVLKQIGIHEITRDRCDVIPEREDVVYWKATKGNDQSGEKLAILEAVAERVNTAHAQQLELSGAWRGVSEAVANSVEHAYKLPREDGFTGLPDTRWWMFTQLRQGTFTMAVCDLGCGYRATIAQTLPEKFISEALARFAGGNRDATAIRAAMEYGRSGTKRTERGKGSRDALSVVQKHGSGELLIFSNTGWMRYIFRGGEQIDEVQGDLGIDIRGTIIWWKLPLKGAENDHG
ncbi:hypothetical protein EJO68_11605 [Variovorax atrisoli]|nr:hypothetical protein EJO68_11605 [Variovorax sp. 369]